MKKRTRQLLVGFVGFVILGGCGDRSQGPTNADTKGVLPRVVMSRLEEIESELERLRKLIETPPEVVDAHVVRANVFRLTNSQGEVVGWMGTEKNGSPALAFGSNTLLAVRDGKSILAGETLRLKDADSGAGGVTIQSDEKGRWAIRVHDAMGNPTLFLNSGENGDPELHLVGTDADTMITLKVERAKDLGGAMVILKSRLKSRPNQASAMLFSRNSVGLLLKDLTGKREIVTSEP